MQLDLSTLIAGLSLVVSIYAAYTTQQVTKPKLKIHSVIFEEDRFKVTISNVGQKPIYVSWLHAMGSDYEHASSYKGKVIPELVIFRLDVESPSLPYRLEAGEGIRLISSPVEGLEQVVSMSDDIWKAEQIDIYIMDGEGRAYRPKDPILNTGPVYELFKS